MKNQSALFLCTVLMLCSLGACREAMIDFDDPQKGKGGNNTQTVSGKIYYMEQDEMTLQHSIWIMDASGANKKQLIAHGALCSLPQGGKICYVDDSYNPLKLYVANSDGTNPQFISDMGVFSSAALSPDGLKVLYVSQEYDNVQNEYVTSLFTAEASGGNIQKIATGISFDAKPSWSPNSQRIAYFTEAAGIGSGGKPPVKPKNADTVYAINADGSNKIVLKAGDIEVSSSRLNNILEWSPGGETILCLSAPDGNNQGRGLMVVKADGSGVLTPSLEKTGIQWATWTPGGSTILCHYLSGTTSRLAYADADGSHIRDSGNLATTVENSSVSFQQLSPDGNYLLTSWFPDILHTDPTDLASIEILNLQDRTTTVIAEFVAVKVFWVR